MQAILQDLILYLRNKSTNIFYMVLHRSVSHKCTLVLGLLILFFIMDLKENNLHKRKKKSNFNAPFEQKNELEKVCFLKQMFKCGMMIKTNQIK